MSKAKFTKGPWVLNKGMDDHCLWGIDLVRHDNFGKYHHTEAISIVVQMSSEQVPNPELSANAYLIAQAPAMYELLDRVSKFMPVDPEEADLINEIIDTLAKARGDL